MVLNNAEDFRKKFLDKNINIKYEDVKNYGIMCSIEGEIKAYKITRNGLRHGKKRDEGLRVVLKAYDDVLERSEKALKQILEDSCFIAEYKNE